jgi:hypothetical protein
LQEEVRRESLRGQVRRQGASLQEETLKSFRKNNNVNSLAILQEETLAFHKKKEKKIESQIKESSKKKVYF